MKNKSWIYITIMAVISIIPVFWFRQSYVNGGDFMFPMAPTYNVLTNYSHIWTDKWGLGLVNSRAIPQLPLMALLTLAGQLGISTAISERILFYLIFLTSGISVYSLVHILPFDENKRMIAFFAALFYMFNPFNIIFYWHMLDGMIFVYAVLPALTVLYLQWFRTRKLLYALSFFALTYFGGYTFSNPLIIPILWMLLLSFNFLITDFKKQYIEVLKFWVTSGILWSLVNCWWLVPLFGSVFDEYSGLATTIGTPWDTLKAFSIKTSLLNLLRLSDLYWAFGEYFGKDPFYNYAAVYQSGLFTAISFIVPVIVFLPLTIILTKKKLPKFILLIYGFTLCLIFLAKGSHAPLGRELYNFLFSLPFISAFRAPIHKLGVLLSICYAVLFGYGMSTLYVLLKKTGAAFSFIIMSVVSGLTLIILPYPLWTGEVIHEGGKDYPSFHVSVPEYYSDASGWLDSDREYFRFYSIPQSPTFNVAYKWEHGFLGGDPSFNLFSKPGVYSTVDPIAQLPYTLLRDEDAKDIYKVLRLQGVKYALLHKDINDKLWDSFSGKHKSANELESALKNQNRISLAKEFGRLGFYRLDDDAYLPPLYASDELLVVVGGREVLDKLINTDYLDGRPAIVFSDIQNTGILENVFYDQNGQYPMYSQILFANREFNDLSAAISRDAVNSRNNPMPVKLNKAGDMDFTIRRSGIFDVYIKSDKLNGTGAGLKIQIDRDKLEYRFLESQDNTQWADTGRVNLNKGSHRISVRCAEYSCEPETLGRLIDIILTEAKGSRPDAGLPGSKGTGYLFYTDPSDNLSRISRKNLYLPEAENYSIRALIKPIRKFTRSGIVSSSYSLDMKASTPAVQGWGINSKNSLYRRSFSEDGMHLDVFFPGRVKDEEVILKKEFSGVNIAEMPYLQFFWDAEDPDLHEILIEIELTDTRRHLLQFNAKKINLSVHDRQYVVDLRKTAEDLFGKKTSRHLTVNNVALKFRKGDSANTSGKLEMQRFRFRDLAFSKTWPLTVTSEDNLSNYSPDTFYYFDKDGAMHNTKFPEQVPISTENVFKLHARSFIDLEETPSLSFYISDTNSLRPEGNGFLRELKVNFGLDIEGDEKEDGRVEVLVPVSVTSNGKIMITLRALENAKKIYPGKIRYNLTELCVSGPLTHDAQCQHVINRQLISYTGYSHASSDHNGTIPDILEVNGRVPDHQEREEGSGSTLIEFRNVTLNKGDNSLSVLENDRFRVERLEIRPETAVRDQGIKADGYPGLEFKKISPTMYIADVKNAKGAFSLVFSENFHKGWKAYKLRPETENDKPVKAGHWSALWSAWTERNKRVEIKDHFIVNGYANGWIVPVGPEQGKQGTLSGQGFQVVLEFEPQRLFDTGVMISAITLFLYTGFCGAGQVRRRRNSRHEN